MNYFQNAVDLGDRLESAGEKWIGREQSGSAGEVGRGDGTREQLKRVVGIFIFVGLMKKAEGDALLCGCARLS